MQCDCSTNPNGKVCINGACGCNDTSDCQTTVNTICSNNIIQSFIV